MRSSATVSPSPSPQNATPAVAPASRKNKKFHVWRTQQMQTDSDPAARARTTLRELSIYFFYIVVTCILAFTMTSPVTYRYTAALKAALLEAPINPASSTYNTYSDISNVEDVWDWLENPMVSTLFPTHHYNGVPLNSYESGFVLDESKMLGIPRLRTLKVVNGSCDVPDDFKLDIFGCFGAYEPNSEDHNRQFPATTDNNESEPVFTNVSAWYYQSQEELDGRPYEAIVSTYNGGGFTQLLSGGHELAADIVSELKALRWFTEGTRVLFVDFAVYNANINLFSVVKIVFEFPASGGVVVSNKFSTMRLLRYVDSFDDFVFACEVFFCIFVLYYTIEEIFEIRHMGLYNYVTSSIWSILDLTILVFSYVAILFNVYRYTLVENRLSGLIDNSDDYANFDSLVYWQEQFNLLIALTLFLSWIKVFKYLSFNRTMTQMSQTLSQCANDILGYTVMFFIVFFSYAQLGYLVFSANTYGFHTFSDSVFTLFRIILGDFDFYALEQSHRVFGPIYFITYVFFVFFILINVFLAIINDSYTKVKDNLDRGETSFEVAEYLSSVVSRTFTRGKTRQLNDPVSAPINDAISTTDKKSSDDGEQDTQALNSAIAEVNGRVDRMEEALASTITKIDAILVHLENIEIVTRRNAQNNSEC